MSIHPTRTGRWEVRWREGSRNRSRTFDRKGDARDFDGEVRRQAQFGGVVPRRSGGKTLASFIEHDWLPTKFGELAPKTLHEYAATIDRHIVPTLGHVPLRSIQPARLHEWQSQVLGNGAGRESIARATKLLKQILDHAVRLEEVPRNVAISLKTPRSPHREGQAASPAEVEALRAWFGRDDDLGSATLVSVLAYVGLRPSEALALRFDDIHERHLLIERALTDGQFKATKTNRSRLADLPRAVASDLTEWSLATGTRRGLVFPRANDGHPWRQSDWNNWRRRHFDVAASDCDLKHLVSYDLRHTAASLQIAAGVSIPEVAENLGHSTATCARVYAHPIKAMRGREPKPLEDMISEARADSKRQRAG